MWKYMHQKDSTYSKLLSPKTLHIWLKFKANVMLKSLLYKFDAKTHRMDANRMFNLIIIHYLDKWPKLCRVENNESVRTIVHILCLGQMFTHRGIEWCWPEYLRIVKINTATRSSSNWSNRCREIEKLNSCFHNISNRWNLISNRWNLITKLKLTFE